MSTWSHEQINNRLDVLAARYLAATDRDGVMFTTVAVGFGTVIALIALTSFVIDSHADGYRAAGVPGGQAGTGAIVAQVFVVVATVAAILLFRAGRLRPARILALVAAGLLLLFAILPNVVGGSSWLTTFLAVLTALLLHLLVGTLSGIAALLSRPPQPSTALRAEREPKESPHGNR
jgi:hypothetical protein